MSSYSDAFTAEPDYCLTITDAVQDGDQFRVSYRVANRGNAPADEGTRVSLELVGLYGDLDSQLYGNVKNSELYSADITDKLPAKTVSVNQDDGTGSVMKSVFEDEQMVTIPASVFRHCGYDALTLSLLDADDNILATTSQKLVAMDAPMNLSLNDGKSVSLSGTETKQVDISYDTTAFINNGPVAYTVADPDVAEVDENGNVSGVGNGATTLTATLMPSGRSVSVPVTVTGIADGSGGNSSSGGGGGGGGGGSAAPAGNPVSVPAAGATAHGKVSSSAASARAGEKVTLTATPDAGYTVGQVTVTDANGNVVPVTQNADGTYSFTMPATAVSVNALFLAEGEHMVNVPAQSSVIHGKTTAQPAAAREGGTVTVTVTPDTGYRTVSVGVKDADGNLIPVTDNGNGTYSFTMPATAVSVLPVFEKLGSDAAACPKDATCPISRFSDASPNTWYHDGVHWALEKGVMNGTGETTFEPNGSATRAMVVTMLWRMAGEPAGSAAAPFTDVKAGSWYADAVNWAAETGAVKGTSETTFSPDTSVTREQLATILYRYAQAEGRGFTGAWMFPLDFSDAAGVSQWADEAMHWMTMNGVITGMGDGTLAPQDNATRAQIATMFMRFADVMEK